MKIVDPETLVLQKIIRSKTNLAINGAAQAFVEPRHVGRPNVGGSETFIRLAGKMFDRRGFSSNSSCLGVELECDFRI